MMSFKNSVLLEALRIVKKKQDDDNRQDLMRDIHNQEIEDAKPLKNQIGEINGLPVVKTEHTFQKREGEMNTRGEGIKDSILIKALKAGIKKGFSQKTGKTLITFKNKKTKKYNLLVAKYNKDSIVIITIIQGEKDQAKFYWTPKHKDDKKITTESFEFFAEIFNSDFIIELEFVE